MIIKLLTRDQVREARRLQKELHKQNKTRLIGQVMKGKGWINDRQISAILVAQKRYRKKVSGSSSRDVSVPSSKDATSSSSSPSTRSSSSPGSTRRNLPSPTISSIRSKAPASSNGGRPATASAAAQPSTSPTGGSSGAKQKIQKLGKFELHTQIGEGSMGAVFKAYDTEENRTVALKLLPRHLANDREFLARFKREVNTIASLNHRLAYTRVRPSGDSLSTGSCSEVIL